MVGGNIQEVGICDQCSMNCSFWVFIRTVVGMGAHSSRDEGTQ